jgi:hypothetical protein
MHQGLGFKVWGLGFGVRGLGFGDWDLGLRVKVSGFRVYRVWSSKWGLWWNANLGRVTGRKLGVVSRDAGLEAAWHLRQRFSPNETAALLIEVDKRTAQLRGPAFKIFGV